MRYGYWLASLGLAAGKKIRLCYEFMTPQGVFEASEKELSSLPYLNGGDVKRLLDDSDKSVLSEKYERCSKAGINVCTFADNDFPARLKYIPNPPFALFYMGRLPDDRGLKAAIVGARMCSPYGQMMSEKLGEAFGRVDVDVISGMARGVDGASQRGALKGGGRTYAVLGCGVDICYPRENRTLYRDIPQRGGIISEYPPGTQPLSAYFPQRNRIISGLADIVILTEAKEKSGSLITAEFALEQGRDIYCLPGRSTDALSFGTNDLIRQGAGIIVSVEQLLSDLDLIERQAKLKASPMPKNLSRTEAALYRCLDEYPKDISILIRESGLAMTEVFTAIASLREKELVKETFMNSFVRSM